MMTRNKFRTDADLWPGDPAFSDSIYRTNRGTGSRVKLDFSAQVIGSPRKTGKTTQINMMALQQTRSSRYAEGSKIFIKISESKGGVSEQQLRDLLIADLRAAAAPTFEEIIMSSKVISDYPARMVLALINVENLQEEALRWLLRGIKILEQGNTAQNIRLQVLIDGSFAVDTLTWGRNSEFPLVHLYPPEFTPNYQKEFVDRRVSDLKLKFTTSAYQTLWQVTAGDKYLTQAICQRVVAQVTPVRKLTVDECFLSELIDNYAKEDPKSDHLKPDLIHSFFLIAEASPNKESYVKGLLENVSTRWNDTPVTDRAHAYKGGIIRRTDDGVTLRAPLILNIFEQANRRVRQVRALLTSRFTPTGVSVEYKGKAEQVTRDIIDLIYKDSLKTLHVGYGTKTNDGAIHLENVAALYQGQYSGSWEIATEPSIKAGDEVWGLLWSWEDIPGERSSKMCVLPAKK